MQRNVDLLPHLGHRRATSATIALALLLIPLSSAQGVDDFSFSRGDAPELLGISSVLTGVHVRNAPATSGIVVAGNISVFEEFQETQLAAGPFAAPGDSGTNSQPFESNNAEVSLEDFSYLMIDFIEGFSEFNLGKSSIRLGQGLDGWGFNPDANSEPPSIDLSEQLQIQGQNEFSLQIQGSFSFSLWNAELTSESESYWAGTRILPITDGAPSLAQAGVGKSREQVLHVAVEDGFLDIPFIRAPVELVAESLQASGQQGIRFEDAFTLAGASLGEVEAPAAWNSILEGGASLSAKDFEANELTVSGQIAKSQSYAWLWWTVSILGAIGLGLLYRQTSYSHIRRMESELNRGDYVKVAKHRMTGLLKSRHGGKASLYRSTSLLAMGLFQEATLFLAALEPRSRPDPATYHFLQAHALAGVGSKHEAARHLLECLNIAPSYAREAEAIPMMQELMGRIGVARSMMDDQYV